MCTLYIESQKWLPMATSLRTKKSAMSSSDSLTRKPTPRIKQRVASYHTTEVIAQRKAKRGCHGNVPQHLWTPIQHMIPTTNSSPLPKRHPYRFSRLCTDDRIECPYTLQWDAHSHSKIFPFPSGDLDPHLIHGSPGPPKSSTQTAARSVQPFLQGSLVCQTDRPTDHATRSVRIGRLYVRSTAMRPNNAIRQHFVKRQDFCATAFRQVLHKHWLDKVGK